jgi:hypothetical protein
MIIGIEENVCHSTNASSRFPFQLAFVSFTEFTNAGRCFLPVEVENGGYVRSRIFTGLEQVTIVASMYV